MGRFFCSRRRPLWQPWNEVFLDGQQTSTTAIPQLHGKAPAGKKQIVQRHFLCKKRKRPQSTEPNARSPAHATGLVSHFELPKCDDPWQHCLRHPKMLVQFPHWNGKSSTLIDSIFISPYAFLLFPLAVIAFPNMIWGLLRFIEKIWQTTTTQKNTLRAWPIRQGLRWAFERLGRRGVQGVRQLWIHFERVFEKRESFLKMAKTFQINPNKLSHDFRSILWFA